MDIHFHGYKIKYEMLDEYFRVIRSGTPIHSINIFINLDDFFHKLHQPLINQEFQVIGQRGPKQMVSNVINLMAHYRHYAKSRLHCDTVNIFGIYTTESRKFGNVIYNKEYRKRYSEINSPTSQQYFYINQILKDSYDMMSGISKYIPGVYIVDSGFLEPSVVPLYLSEKKKCDWNVLITRDIYDLQYASLEKWTIISPKGENSSIVSGENIWDYIAKRERVKIDGRRYPLYLLVLLLSVAGDKYRSIPRLRKVGWKTLYKFMDMIMDEFGDMPDMIIENKMLELLQNRKSVHNEELNNNIQCVSIIKQKANIGKVDTILLDMQVVDRYDQTVLISLNREIFRQYPLRIEFLS